MHGNNQKEKALNLPTTEEGTKHSSISKHQTSYEKICSQLDYHYKVVKEFILPYQSPTTGLFSCNKEAYIHESIYCAVASWSVALGYRRVDSVQGRKYELEHAAVKCMRGILYCFMRQAEKVETFKKTQKLESALHCKFDYFTGDTVADDEYPHLQLHVIALFLLYIMQMISSGLQIIFNTDEVAFCQNLVYYLERAYRTPDFGLWKRGSKYNNGLPELHASSVGVVKAVLESANGFNLFGHIKGAPWSVLWVDIDAHNRNRTVFDILLPKVSC